MKYTVASEWTESNGHFDSKELGFMNEQEAEKAYADEYKWLKWQKEKGNVKSFKICILRVTDFIEVE